MADYNFEEHKCPFCEHQFVVEMRGAKYVLKGGSEEHFLTKCPKCGYKLYVASRWKYGCLADFIPEKDVKVVKLCV